MTKQINIKKKRKYSISLFAIDFFLFLLMYVSDATLFMRSMSPLLQSFRKFFPIICIVGLLFYLIVKKKAIDTRLFFYCIFFALTTLLSALFFGGSMNAIFMFLLKICACALVVAMLSQERFEKSFLRLMRVIALFALISYIIYQIYPNFANLFPHYTSLGSKEGTTLEWANLLFTQLPLTGGENWSIRNFGPFWEPGAFAIYLNIALFLILFSAKQSKKLFFFDLILFGATLLTTLSSGGIIAFVALMIAYIFHSDSSNKHLKMSIFLLVLGGLIYIFYFNPYFSNMFYDRLNTSNGSFDSRFYSIGGNLWTFIKSPLFGVGITNVDSFLADYYYNVIGNSLRDIHNTNTLLIYFASGGLLIGLLQAFSWMKFLQRKKNFMCTLCLFAFLFLLLMNEDMTGSFIFILFPIYGIIKRKDASHESPLDQ